MLSCLRCPSAGFPFFRAQSFQLCFCEGRDALATYLLYCRRFSLFRTQNFQLCFCEGRDALATYLLYSRRFSLFSYTELPALFFARARTPSLHTCFTAAGFPFFRTQSFQLCFCEGRDAFATYLLYCRRFSLPKTSHQVESKKAIAG